MYEATLVSEAGLTPGEAKTYLALLELGTATAGPIIEKSGVARSFIYNILNALIEKGLASYVLKDKTRHYQAAEPSRIIDYIQKRKQQLEKNQEKMLAVLQKLLLLQASAPTTAVSVFEGFKGIQTCFERYQQKLKPGDEYLCLGIYPVQEEKYHQYWKKHHQQRHKEKITCRMLFNNGTDDKTIQNRNSSPGSQARIMPNKLKTPGWFFIYADVVCIFLQSNEQIAIEIINQEIANTFKQYFEEFWSKTRPYNPTKN
jgi:sugar-specific transcriptional regulator TrmB